MELLPFTMKQPAARLQLEVKDIIKEIYGNNAQDITPTLTRFTDMLGAPQEQLKNVQQSQSLARLQRARSLYLRSLEGVEKVQSSHLREMACCFDESEHTLESVISIGSSMTSTNATTMDETAQAYLPVLGLENENENEYAMMVGDMQAFVLSILSRTCVLSIPHGELLQVNGPRLQHKKSEVFYRFGRRLREKIERTTRGKARSGNKAL